MMTEPEIKKLIEKHSSVVPGMRKMVADICQPSIIGEISESELIEKIQLIVFEHKASTPSDDDEYWTVQSPFNGKWHTFAAFFGSSYPTKSVWITDSKPELFDQDY